MSDCLKVLWTVIPLVPPMPRLPCGRCGKVTSFACQDKFRVNAQGRRIDAWLIYQCSVCGHTWNRPILERQAVSRIDRSMLSALQQNDPSLVQRFAFDYNDLKRHSPSLENSPEVVVRKDRQSTPSGPVRRIAIKVVAKHPAAIRLDRLLAQELALSRQRLTSLWQCQRLELEPPSARLLKRPVQNGTALVLHAGQDSFDPLLLDGAARNDEQR